MLRTMPKEQQSLLMAHFSPDVARILARIEQETKVDVEKLDWTPFYQTWPELQRILADCKKEIKIQKLVRIADEQRPRLKEYMLVKLGMVKKGPPILLSKEVQAVVDKFLTDMEKI